MAELITLTKEHMAEFCQPHTGATTCRYLAFSTSWECLKLTYFKENLDERVKNNTIRAKGDNCPGLRRGMI